MIDSTLSKDMVEILERQVDSEEVCSGTIFNSRANVAATSLVESPTKPNYLAMKRVQA